MTAAQGQTHGGESPRGGEVRDGVVVGEVEGVLHIPKLHFKQPLGVDR